MLRIILCLTAYIAFTFIASCSTNRQLFDGVTTNKTVQQTAISFDSYIMENDVRVGVVFSVDVTEGWAIAPSTIYRDSKAGFPPAECATDPDDLPRHYPWPTKTVPEWVPPMLEAAESFYIQAIPLTINSSFFISNKDNPRCAQIFGTVRVPGFSPNPGPIREDCRATESSVCYPIDALFGAYTRNSNTTSKSYSLVTSGDIDKFYKTHNNAFKKQVLSAVGGIIFLRDGEYIPKPALKLHKRDSNAARMVIGMKNKPSGVSKDFIYVIYIAQGRWLDPKGDRVSGMTVQKLVSTLKGIGITEAIMLDGGGSATIALNGVDGWNGPAVLPVTPLGNRGYRPVPNVMGFGLQQTSGK